MLERRRAALVWGVLMMHMVVMAGCSAPAGGTSPAEDADDPNGIGEPVHRTDSYFDLFPEFPAFEASGTGDQEVALQDGTWAGVVTVAGAGEGFRLEVVDDSREVTTLIEVGEPYAGSVAYGLDGEEDAAALRIVSDGPWALTVGSVRDAPDLPPSGAGDGVYWNLGADTRTVGFSFLAQGRTELTTYPNYASPEVKTEYSGRTDAKAGRDAIEEREFELNFLDELVTIRTPGAWTMTDL